MRVEQGSRVFGRREDVLARAVAGESLLIPVRGELADLQRVFALNPAAEAIWQLLDGRRSVGEIARSLEERFEVTADAARADVLDFVGALVAQGLASEVSVSG